MKIACRGSYRKELLDAIIERSIPLLLEVNMTHTCNVICGSSLEVPQRDSFNEHHNHRY